MEGRQHVAEVRELVEHATEAADIGNLGLAGAFHGRAVFKLVDYVASRGAADIINMQRMARELLRAREVAESEFEREFSDHEEAAWRKEAMGDAKERLAVGDPEGAFFALTRHESPDHMRKWEDHMATQTDGVYP